MSAVTMSALARSPVGAANGRRERGFTLLEILLAMTILVLGGVSVISLFAAAVTLQFDSVVNERKAMILSDIVSEAQQVLNDHRPTKEEANPPDIERKESSLYPNEFEYKVEFRKSGYIPPGEGAIAHITMFYRDQALEPVNRILMKTIFAAKEIEKSISLERDRAADAAAEQEKQDEDRRASVPK
ncbi:MAG: type II secretion system protein [Planctomycetota bacterium]